MKNSEKKPRGGYPVAPMLGRLIANAWAQNKALFAQFAVYTLTAGIYPLLGVALPKLVLDEVMRGAGARLNILMFIILGVFAAQAALGYVRTYINRATFQPLCLLRLDYIRDLFAKLMGMDYKNVEDAGFFNEHERAMHATNSNDSGIEGIYHRLFEAPAELLTVAAFVALIGSKSPLILAALLLNIAAQAYISRRTHAYTHERHADLGRAERKKQYYSKTTYDFGFGKDIRIYDLKARVLGNFRDEIQGYVDIHSAIKRREFRLGFLGLGALLISDAAVYGLLIRDAALGMPIADFAMYLSAAVTLSVVMKSFVQKAAEILNEGHFVHDFYAFLDSDLGEKGGALPAVANDTLEIVFDNVSFKYPKTDRYVLKNLNLTIRKGERLAVVGINGAGKTTLVKLMTGLFAVTEGEIRINGVPIGEFDKKELYSMFSVVFQDVNVLAYSVLENVAGTTDGDRARVADALERAGLGDKVRSLPKGLDQPMLKIIEEDGVEFSGGESQKLAIARALYKNANMVIMDEPTAALDALAEAEIYGHFADLIAGKTAVYISHRLASTKFCDKIAFFNADGLREYGSHDELMALGGEYRHMFTVQGKYYNMDTEEGEAV